MKRTTTIGKMYAVTSAAGCTVTTPDGLPICTVEAGTQGYFTAPTSTVEVDDDAALLTATFNRAALALRLLGGGVKSELPAGYLRAEFLAANNGGVALGIQNTEVQKIEFEVWMGVVNELPVMGYTTPRVYFNYHGGMGWSIYAPPALGPVKATEGREWQKPANDLKRILADFISRSIAINGEENSFDQWNNHPVEMVESEYKVLNINTTSKRYYYWLKVKTAAGDYDFIPCLTPAGVPTFYEKANKLQTTSGGCIAGFTLSQARKLGKHLPASGGKLTISLPTGYEQDAAVAESLETARARGWTLTIQTYTPEAEAAATTFGMRRVWVRRTQDAQGGYVDADGVRWAVDWCVDMVTPDGSTPDAHGYELYRSTEAAVAYWELTPWVDPEAEEEFLTTESL